MIQRSITVALLFTAVLVRYGAAEARDDRVSIFVGPQTRDGFVDVDSGVLDSIKDIQAQIGRSPRFTLVATKTDATMVLSVIGRRSPGTSGGTNVPIGFGMTVMVPIKRRAVDTILRVGKYEKAITSETEDDDRWSAAAKKVVKDLTVWIDANRAALAELR